MPDIVDRANELVMQRMDDALSRHHPHSPTVQHAFCIDCEQAIPKERLAKVPDAERCVECQTVHEKQEAIRAGRR